MKSNYILAACMLMLAIIACNKELGNDPNNNGNGGNGGGGGGTIDTTIFVIEGIKVTNGSVIEKGYSNVKIKADFSAFTIQSFTVPRYGHVVSKTNPRPDINDNDGMSELFNRTGKGEFTSQISGLEPGVTYYARVYLEKSDNATGAISYGYHPYAISFTTLNPEPPNVAITGSSNISSNSFNVTGQITDFKGEDVLKHGFVWSKTNTQPTRENCDDKVEFGPVSVTTSHDFDAVISNLEPNTTYYVRSFAENAYGVSYKNGNQNTVLSVKTSPPPAPHMVVSGVIVSEPNGTGNVNPGEEVRLSIILKNDGNAEANGVKLSISTSPYYTILSTLPIDYGTIVAGGQKMQEVLVSVGNTVPWNTFVSVDINISDDQGTSWNYPDAADFTVISPYVVTGGLGFYVRFNECSGPTAASVVGNNTGEVFGADFTGNGIPGVSGCAMSFIETNEDYVQFTTNPLSGYANATLSFWMKTLSGETSIMSVESNASSEKLDIYNNRFQSSYMGPSGVFDFNLTNYLDNNWHHFVLVADDGGKSKLYIDGAFKYEKNKNFSVTNQTGFYIGRSRYDFFNGSLDNVRIYNRALSASEVQQIYNAKQ